MAKNISMTNISAEPVRITIGGAPGEGVTEYVIAPGKSQDFPEGFCIPVPGRGPEAAPSIMARKSTRTWPDGSRKPTLVPTSELKAKAPAPENKQQQPGASR